MKNIISFFTDADAKRAYVLLAIVILMAAPFFLTALYFQNEAGWIKWLVLLSTAAVSYLIGRALLSHIETKDIETKDPSDRFVKTLNTIWGVMIILFGAGIIGVYTNWCLAELFGNLEKWQILIGLFGFVLCGVFMPTKEKVVNLTKSLRLKVIGNMPNLEEEDDSEVRVLGYTLPQKQEDDSEVRVLSYTKPQKEEDDSEVEVIGYTKPKTE